MAPKNVILGVYFVGLCCSKRYFLYGPGVEARCFPRRKDADGLHERAWSHIIGTLSFSRKSPREHFQIQYPILLVSVWCPRSYIIQVASVNVQFLSTRRPQTQKTFKTLPRKVTSEAEQCRISGSWEGLFSVGVWPHLLSRPRAQTG